MTPPILLAPHKFGLKNTQDRIFLPLTAALVKLHNPDANIYFINTNDFSFDLPGITVVDTTNLDKYDSDIKNLELNYKHLSTNPYSFELECIKRFFYLRALIERLGCDECYVVESDVVMLAPVNLISKEGSAVLTDSQCISTSWLSLEFLHNFCDSTLQFYENQKHMEDLKQWHSTYVSNGGKGGICDMTLCSYIARGLYGFGKMDVYDFCSPIFYDGEMAVFDSFIGQDKFSKVSSKFKTKFDTYSSKIIKDINFTSGVARIETELGEKFRLLSIHCQGNAKDLIGRFIVEALRG